MYINIININDFDINNINLSKLYSINLNLKKIAIGYNNNIDLHIETPLLLNNMNYISNIKYNSFKIRFEPLLGSILKFYNIIIQIEQYIKIHIHKYYKDYILHSIIKNDKIDCFDDSNDYIQYILLDIHNNLSIFNNINELSILSDLKYKDKYKSILNIDSIWINTITKKFGLKIEIIQLKIIKPIATIKCLIDNNEIIHKNVHNEIIHKNVQNEIQTQIQTNNIIIQQPLLNVEKLIFRPPDPSQLLQLKKSLKKVIE